MNCQNLLLSQIFLVLFLVCHESEGNISLGSCSCYCKDNEQPDLLGTSVALQGRPGKHGPAGPKGERGVKGDVGVKGYVGIKGDLGQSGVKGDRGIEGKPGVKGDVGVNGDVGVKGESGVKGDRGIQGNTGVKGDVGVKGDIGVKGESGVKGDRGIQGITGVKGDIGVKGESGAKGDRGYQGNTGVKGNIGLRGIPGQACDCSRYDELANQMAALQGKVNIIEVQQARNGWYKASNNHYYTFFNHERVNYATAKSRCASFGGRLAAAGLRTTELRTEIKRLLRASIHYTWIGLDDWASQGNYVWSDGVPSTRSNTKWHPGQPSESFERCAVINDSAGVWDIPCSYNNSYICEF